MKYAEISVNSPAARRRTFSYAVPEGMDVRAGQAVLVPFGEKVLQGIVMELTALPAVEDTREIIDIIDPEPILSEAHLKLARWISGYYLSPLFDAVALMLPPGFERNAVAFISRARGGIDPVTLYEDQRRVIDLVPFEGKIEVKKIEKALGKKKAASVISQMINQGLLARSYELSQVRVKPKTEQYIELSSGNFDNISLSPKQATLFAFLKEIGRPVPWTEARKKTGCTKAAAQSLVKQGIAVLESRERSRAPISYDKIPLSFPLNLTPAQQSVFDSINSEMGRNGASKKVFLLRGITASGKTEIYLQLLAETIKQGKKGIILVPEIALTVPNDRKVRRPVSGAGRGIAQPAFARRTVR